MITEITEVTVKTEHRLKVGNDIMVDVKDLTTTTSPDGQEITILNHSRNINEREYIVRNTMKKKDGKTLESESTRISQMSDQDAKEFLEEWNRKWKKRVITEPEVKTATDEAVKQAKRAKLQNNTLQKKESKTPTRDKN